MELYSAFWIICGYFFWQGLWIALSRSPLIPDLMEWNVTKVPMLPSDVEAWLFSEGHYKLHRLYTCVFCQAFWISLAQGITCGLLLALLLSPVWIFTVPLWTLCFYPWYLNAFLRLWKR